MFPDVWIMYSYLRKEKKLVMPIMDGPKDEDELKIIYE
jgi:hypothetical protein